MNKSRQNVKRRGRSSTMPIVFKRWTRTRYGAFNSLGKVVKIGVVGITMTIVSPATTGFSQSSDTLSRQKVLELETAEIVESKPTQTNSTTLPIPIFNLQTESRCPLLSTEDALKLSPSIDLRERGTKGVQADISIRGGSFDQAMILLNGIDFSDARTGHQSHSLPIDLEITNSIDLITNIPLVGALTGAINFLTPPFKDNAITASLEIGSFGYGYANLSGSYTINKLSILAATSYRRSDGYIDNTDFQTINVYSRLMYDSPKIGLFDFQIGYQNKAFGANSFYSMAYPNQFEATQTGLTSLTWSKSIKRFSIRSSVGYRYNSDHYELFRDYTNAPEWYIEHNNHFVNNLIATLGSDYDWQWGRSSIGIDYSCNYLESNVLGNRTRNVVNAWVRQTLQLRKFSLLGAITLSSSSYGLTPLWSISAGYDIADNWDITLNANRSMRLPTFTDLYYTTSTHIANHDLNPETATTFQAAVTYRYKGFSASLTPYFRQGNNLIDWVKVSESAKWESKQITQINTLGVEAIVSYRTKGVLQNISLAYSYINSNKESGTYISKYVLDYMKNKLVGLLTLKLTKKLYLSTTATLYDRNGVYNITNNETLSYTPYLLLDSRLTFQHKNISLYIQADNILNQKYYDFGGIVQPGVWITGGIKVEISK